MTFMDQPHRLTRQRDSGAARHLTITDIILIAGLAAGGYLASAFLGDGSQPNAGTRQAPARQAVCSDEELRHMRANIDACYDQRIPQNNKSEALTAPGAFNNT
jgi:hypothetical protein